MEPLEQFATDFDSTTKSFFVDRAIYKYAVALTIHWEDHDLDEGNPNAPKHSLAGEATSVRELFQNKFHFTTPPTYSIPSKNPALSLRKYLNDIFLELPQDEDVLLVLYYAGHNDNSDNGQARFAARENGGSTVPWRKIQDLLDDVKADVLLLLDCCHAALVAKAKLSKLDGRMQVLAASAEGVQTPRPGPRSFTSLLVTHMEKQLHAFGKVDMSILHSELWKGKGITETPFIGSMTPSQQGNIVLQPLKHADDLLLTRRSAAQLLLRVSLAGDSTGQEIANWLKSNPPESVTAVRIEAVVSRARMLQGAFDSVAPGDLLRQLPQDAQDKILQQMSVLNGTLRSSESLAAGRVSSTSAPRAFQQIASATAAVADVVETSLLLDLSEEQQINSLKQGQVDDFEMQESILLRQKVLDLAADPPMLKIELSEVRPLILPKSLPSDPFESFKLCRYQKQTCLVELFDYDTDSLGEISKQKERSVVRAAAILNAPKRLSFRILTCMGLFRDESACRYGMVFRLPPYIRQPGPLNLRTLLTKLRQAELGWRIRLAYKLASAMDELHRIGWLHKSVNSSNIVFFIDGELTQVMLGKPWLIGFEYSRPEYEETQYDEDWNNETTIYRHLDRWGLPSTTFSRAHDIHSLGIVLTEIAFWQRITAVGGWDGRGRLQKETFIATIKSKCIHRLPHMVGQYLADAIMACFNFGSETEGKSESEMQRHFQFVVRDKLRAAMWDDAL